MPLRDSKLPGVHHGILAAHPDDRGWFAEVWRAAGLSTEPGFGAVQANLSESRPGVLRGLHFHARQADRWVVLSGRAFVALVDVRPMLRGEHRPAVETVELGPKQVVTIPAGVAHGFLALTPLELLYFVTNTYDGTDELGFAWDDPDAGIDWPSVPTGDGRPIVSERDATNPALAQLVATLRSAGLILDEAR